MDEDAKITMAISKVSSTISALESAIATYDAMEKKPEQYAETISSMRKLLSKLEAWERKSLKDLKASSDAKKKDISDLITIANTSKGDF